MKERFVALFLFCVSCFMQAAESPKYEIRAVWYLDVGSSHPGAEVRSKGWAVRPLKRYASWVQNVARQFGPYLSWAQDI